MRPESLRSFLAVAVLGAIAAGCDDPAPRGVIDDGRVRVLFLGDRGHHAPAARCQQLLPVLAARGIDLFYTESLADLEPSTLARYDALAIYANQESIEPEQERALEQFVAGGKGLVAIHCASYCFLNSDRYVELVGARFLRHGTGTFTTTFVAPDHPVLRGLEPFESWDETYVHERHGQDRTVLSVRDGEPWTWVRDHGEGRVFYTAWGHDQRTWSNPGFCDLIERGIRYSCGDWALDAKPELAPFAFSEATVPQYVPGKGQARLSSMQDPLPPEQSIRHLVVPPELEVELFVAEPEIVKPIAMAWDERGRLWIAETIDYPNDMKRPADGRDRIKICEDRDGDGRADRFTVFAEGLSIPTGLVFAGGGVIVSQAPDMLILRDTDGDDRADERAVLFSGFGTRDTHAGPSNLRYGLDNRVWGSVGYSGFDGTVGGRRRSFRQGFYRFEPDASSFEFLASTTNNTWGLGFSEDGLVFGSTANGNPSVYLAIPNRYYEAVRGWSSGALQTIAETLDFHPITTAVRQVDWHGKFTAGAGHAVYTARELPRAYWNRAAFVAGPTGHLLGRLFLERRGTDFVSRDGWNLLASDDEWTAPIQAEVGPDGAVWVIDWYNYIVQHNPTPNGFTTGKGSAYETPLRDKTHGRIYRIVPRDRALRPQPDLRTATPEVLVETLANDNMFWRLTAQRLLVERGERDVVPALLRRLAEPRLDAIGLDPGALHALWTLHGLGALDDPAGPAAAAAVAAFAHPSAAVRRAALLVAPRDAATRDLILDRGPCDDPDPHVRLAALLALSETPPSERAGRAVFDLLQQPRNLDDRWIPDAATAAAARHDAGFLEAALAVEREDAAKPEPATNLLENPSIEDVTDGAPAAWSVRHYGGRAAHELSDVARTGSHSLKITSARGADTSWQLGVAVEPESTYRLSGWIKTEGVTVRGNARGALFNVHELQTPAPVRTEPVRGTTDWTRVEVTFETGGRSAVSINCLFGGWGYARGTAWFDDVELVRVGRNPVRGKLGTVIGRVSRHYAARVPSESVVSTVLALRGAPAALQASFLEGLVEGWPAGTAPELDDADGAALAALLGELGDDAKPRLLALADRWGRRDVLSADAGAVLRTLRATLADGSSDATARALAAARLIGLDDRPETVEAVLQPISPGTDPALAGALLDALAASTSDATGALILARWGELSPAARRNAVRTLSRRRAWTRGLLEEIRDERIPVAAVEPQRWLQLQNHPDAGIAALAAAAHGRAVDPDRSAVVERLMPVAGERGDATRGEALFQTQCALCHSIGGQGGKVGPSLDGIGARPREEILLAILDPNRSVESNYQLWVVETRDGVMLAGRLDAENETSIELYDLAGQKHAVQRKDIAKLTASATSIMPATFEVLGTDGLADLLEFLARDERE